MDLLELARSTAFAYAATGNVGALLVAGSVARGAADDYSDLELDVYWSTPPSDRDRRAVVEALRGELVEKWPYDADEGEWSESYRLHGHEVGVSGFTVDWMRRCIDEVVRESDPDARKQMRLAALNDGLVLLGHDVVEQWRQASRQYPEALAIAVAGEFLAPERLASWHQRDALAARGDVLFLRAQCLRIAEMVLGALCAVNQVLIEHLSFKWSARLIERLHTAPADLQERLLAAIDGPTAAAVPILDALLRETIAIVSRELPAVPLDDLRRELDHPRGEAGCP